MKLAWNSVVLLPVLLLPVVVTQAQTCSNGLAGYEASSVCCPVSCGQCGGVGCSSLGDGCCTSGVKDSGLLCSVEKKAPCNIDTATVDSGDGGETCSNGIEGIDGNGVVCCASSCGTCGGSGCSSRPGGASSCCGGSIKAAGELCSDSGEAPCVIDEGSTQPEPETCSNGIEGIDGNGVVCCALSCGTCGGSGCSSRDGGGSSCCGGNIKASGVLCSDSGEAPCIIEEAPGPSPTPPGPTPVAPPTNVPSYLITDPTPIMAATKTCTPGSYDFSQFRYAASTGKVGKGRLYAEGSGCFTMTDIYNWRGTVSSGGVISSKGPIYQLDGTGSVVENPGAVGSPVTKKWLLAAELYITGDAKFVCKGGSSGDCDELRIQSNGPDDFYEVRGHGGSLYFENTIVTSWDTGSKAPQAEYEDGRSYLNCVSEKLTGETCEGRAKNDMGECRMDLINSEIGYLGYFDSESYGITWKVRGFCKDLSNHDVFTTTNVYGDIIGSDIHHNYYGHYTYGHQGGVWTDNIMRDNWQYGFDPHDDSDYLTIARNDVHDNVNHGIIASKRCNNVKIYDNTVYNGGAQAAGIFLHRSSDNAEVYKNKVYDMQDAGIAMLESMNAQIYDNDIESCRYGIRMSLGSAGNNVKDNTFDKISEWGLYTYEGSDAPTDGVSNGRPQQNTFDGNSVTNSPQGVKFKNSDSITVINNDFTGTKELEFLDAQGTVWSGNSLPSSGVCVENVTSDDGSSVPESTFTGSSGLPSAC